MATGAVVASPTEGDEKPAEQTRPWRSRLHGPPFALGLILVTTAVDATGLAEQSRPCPRLRRDLLRQRRPANPRVDGRCRIPLRRLAGRDRPEQRAPPTRQGAHRRFDARVRRQPTGVAAPQPGRRSGRRTRRLSARPLDRARPVAGGVRRRRGDAGQPPAGAQPDCHARRPLPGSPHGRRGAGAAPTVVVGGGRVRARRAREGAGAVRLARPGRPHSRAPGRWTPRSTGCAVHSSSEGCRCWWRRQACGSSTPASPSSTTRSPT